MFAAFNGVHQKRDLNANCADSICAKKQYLLDLQHTWCCKSTFVDMCHVPKFVSTGKTGLGYVAVVQGSCQQACSDVTVL